MSIKEEMENFSKLGEEGRTDEIKRMKTEMQENDLSTIAQLEAMAMFLRMVPRTGAAADALDDLVNHKKKETALKIIFEEALADAKELAKK